MFQRPLRYDHTHANNSGHAATQGRVVPASFAEDALEFLVNFQALSHDHEGLFYCTERNVLRPRKQEAGSRSQNLMCEGRALFSSVSF